MGKFWLIRLRASSEAGNSLKFLNWYVLDTEGNIHQDTASDPNYRFDAASTSFTRSNVPLRCRWNGYVVLRVRMPSSFSTSLLTYHR